MADSSIINPGSSSYSLPQPTDAPVGNVPEMPLERTLPRQLSTGSTRGTQTVGYGDTKIDGSNDRFTVTTPDGGQIGFGSIPGTTTNEFGFFSQDSNGKLIMKIVNGTWYVYQPDGTNFMQTGILPDGSGGMVIATEGNSVAEVF